VKLGHGKIAVDPEGVELTHDQPSNIKGQYPEMGKSKRSLFCIKHISWCQFHQRFKRRFYALRFQNCKKYSWSSVSFYAFGIEVRKSCI
jgi:hypothetical protein